MNRPIPDILGGTLERLITMIVEQNEIEQLADLYVISQYNKDAEELSKSYNHCKNIYIKSSGKFINFMCRKISSAVRKIFNINFYIQNPVEFKTVRAIKKINPDYITWGGAVRL